MKTTKEATTDMFGRSKTHRVAIIATTAILSTAMLGGIALAALAPATDTASLTPGLEGAPSAAPAAERADGSKLKAILDALVTKGVITQAQEDAILAALKDTHGDKDRDELLRRVFAGLFEQSATYLGVTPAELKAKLPGTSLGAIAGATSGKSRDGLVRFLTDAVNTAIDKAQSEGKITAEQAAKAKAAAPEHIAKFVDHVYPKRDPRPATPKVQAFIGDALGAAKDYLGLPAKDLMASLRSGKSLGEIADATSGKSRAGLISSITASASAKIDAAVAGGKLTAEQAATLKAALANAVTSLVDHKGHAVGPKPASR